MATQIKLRRDTTSNWSQSNPVLALGEPGFDTTENRLKIGNGVTRWNSLPWIADNPTSYNNLLDKPTIPSDISQLTDNQNLLGNGGLTIADFGEGFSVNGSGKIVTQKLYSTNSTNSAQHYRLELDNNGVVHLPDQSIINGATLKSVPGNYAGITAGPVGADEDSWMWVDSTGAFIATKYNTGPAKQWSFDNTGVLTLPPGGDIVNSNGTSVLGGGSGSTLVNGSYTVNLDGAGFLNLPVNAGGIRQNNLTTSVTNPTTTSATAQVVWTSSSSSISGVKLFITVESLTDVDNQWWHTQCCEAIIAARGSYANGDPVISIYGVVYTGPSALANFTVRRNSSTNLIEVLATQTNTTLNSLYFRIQATESFTRD